MDIHAYNMEYGVPDRITSLYRDVSKSAENKECRRDFFFLKEKFERKKSDLHVSHKTFERFLL